MVSKLLAASSLVALTGSVASAGVPLTFKKHKSTIHSQSLVRRDTGEDLSLALANQESFYSVELSIGTPAQNVTVLLDTGSSDLWVMSSENPYCEPGTADSASDSQKIKRDDPVNTEPVDISLTATLPDNFYGAWTTEFAEPTATASADGVVATNTLACNVYGTFNSNLSSSFKELNYPADFHIEYVDTTQADGIYFTDDFLINGISVPNITAALAVETNSSMGVLGISYEGDEGSSYNANSSLEFTYPNFPVALKNSGAISKIAYSLFLNSLCEDEGSLLFGAVDHSLYTGQLYTIPLVEIYNKEYYPKPFEFDVTVHGVGLVGWETSEQKRTLTQTKFPAVLDSGTTLIELPPGLVDEFADSVGAVWNEELQWYVMECPTDQQNLEAAYVFDFGGVHIYSPVKNFIYTTSDPTSCVLGAFEFTSNGGIYNNYGILGDVVLTAMYVVYDLEDYEVSIAQANYANFGGEGDIEEIVSTVPGAIKAPGYYSTWTTWAPITGFTGTGAGMFTDADETNPWSTTSDFGCAVSSTTTAASSSATNSSSVSTTAASSIASSTGSSSGKSALVAPTSTGASVTSTKASVASTKAFVTSTKASESVDVTVSTSTVSEESTTLVTITSCKDNACKITTSAALVSVATTTVEGIVTEYTTYCPLTAEHKDTESTTFQAASSTSSVVSTTEASTTKASTTAVTSSSASAAAPSSITSASATTVETSVSTLITSTSAIIEEQSAINSTSIITVATDNAGMKFGASFGAIFAGLALIF